VDREQVVSHNAEVTHRYFAELTLDAAWNSRIPIPALQALLDDPDEDLPEAARNTLG